MICERVINGINSILKHIPNTNSSMSKCSGGSRISRREGGVDLVGGGVDSRGSYVSKILYVKTKELGPLGGRARPPRSANEMSPIFPTIFDSITLSLYRCNRPNITTRQNTPMWVLAWSYDMPKLTWYLVQPHQMKHLAIAKTITHQNSNYLSIFLSILTKTNK